MTRFTLPGSISLLAAAILFAAERFAQASVYAAYKFSGSTEARAFVQQLLGYNPVPYALLLIGVLLIGLGLFLPGSERRTSLSR